MFKSLQESVRSLLSTSTNDKKHSSGIKRKRSFCAAPDEEDPDVQIVKVEKKRRIDSHSPFWGIFNLPSKMSDWLRLKSKNFSDQFATTSRDKSHKSDSRDSLSKRNGVPSRMGYNNRSRGHDAVQQRSVADRTAHEISTDIGTVNDVSQPQFNGERGSSVSSGSRPSHYYPSSMHCIRLQEKEEYHKLLKMQMQSKFSSSSSHSFTKEQDALSVSSSSSGDISHSAKSKYLSQTGRLSNTSLYDSRYKFVPNRSFTHSSASDTSVSFSRHKPTNLKTSIAPLIAQQRRRFGFASPTSQTNSKSDKSSSNAVEHKIPSHSEDSVVVIDEDNDDQEHDIVIRADDAKSLSNTNIVNNGISRVQQHKSLDFRDSMYMSPNYMEQLKHSRLMHHDQWKRQVEEEQMKAKAYEEKRRAQNIDLERRLKHQMRIFEEEPEVSEELLTEQEEESEEEVLPELTDSMMEVINSALRPGPPGEILSEAFRLQITRKDIGTLAGLNWLNDEVINFYMNMLIDRGEQEGMAKVYAFNTFFYPKIMSGGHSAVKRWTKKVDIFSMRFILIPVHLGMHWCLCVADMKNKEITYYDSMSGRNIECLNAVLKYINDESVAKKQQPINTAEWKLTTAQDNPQQLNGSDCGMFSCKYADYITREKKISFTQEDMPYFRQRMVYEIKTKRLLE